MIRNLFGFIGSNRLNFAQSIHSKHSRLSEAVRHIARVGYATRREIIDNAWNMPNAASNTNSRFWAGAVRAGILTPVRVDGVRNTYFTLGPNAKYVKR